MQQEKRGVGRPRAIGCAQWKLMEQAFRWGWPAAVACRYARVSRRTFYDLEARSPEIRSHRQALQRMPEMLARKNVAMAIECGDVEMSRWFLKRKAHDFADQQQVVDLGNQDIDEATAMATLVRLLVVSRQRAGHSEGAAQSGC